MKGKFDELNESWPSHQTYQEYHKAASLDLSSLVCMSMICLVPYIIPLNIFLPMTDTKCATTAGLPILTDFP